MQPQGTPALTGYSCNLKPTDAVITKKKGK